MPLYQHPQYNDGHAMYRLQERTASAERAKALEAKGWVRIPDPDEALDYDALGVTGAQAKGLEAAGITSEADLAEADEARLTSVKGIGAETAASLKAKATF